jgi:hypothetical protein
MLLSAGQGGESAAVVEVAVSHEEEPHRPEGILAITSWRRRTVPLE